MDAKQIAIGVIDVVSSLLSGKPGQPDAKKKTIEDVTVDELRLKKVELDQAERKMLNRVRELEADKRKLFEEGVKNRSEREQKLLARKIKELDAEAQNMDRNLELISRQLRIINGFVQLKENQRLLKDYGIGQLVGDMDLAELKSYVERATAQGEFQMDKFNEILSGLEAANNSLSPLGEEDDVMEIVRAMQQAQEAADPGQAVEEKFAQVDSALKAKAKEKSEA